MKEEKYCPVCKTTLSDFYRTGMLGCPDCYESFFDEIEEALFKIQGKTVHVGKKTAGKGVDAELLAEYNRLLKEKEKAGIEGRFPDMVLINTEIEILKEELERRGLR